MTGSLVRYLQSTRTPSRQRAVYLGQRRAVEAEAANAWRWRMEAFAFKREIVNDPVGVLARVIAG